MFEHSLVVDGPAGRWPMVSSLMLQATGVCVVLLVPLIWVEQLPFAAPLAPPLIAPRAPRPPMEVFTAGIIRAAAAVLNTPRPFRAPDRVPTSSPRRIIDGPAAMSDPIHVVAFGPGVPGDSPLTADRGKLPPPHQPKPEPAKQAVTPSSLRVHSDLQASKLIHQVKPPYPPLALQTRTQGVVKLNAVIAPDGSIQRLQVVMGPPLLVQAAVDAVKQWRYSPTLLNGQPVEVVTQIDVNFTLGRP